MSYFSKRIPFQSLRWVLCGLTIIGAACQGAGPEPDLDRETLEKVEDLSESLANTLLDFSVALRDRNLVRMGKHLSDRIEVRLLAFPSPERGGHKWIRRGSAKGLAARDPVLLSRSQALDDWASFLDHFSTIEDARLKVTGADFSSKEAGIQGSGRIKFFVVGRDPAFKRLSVKGTGLLKALYLDEAWSISSLTMDTIDAGLAETDLFSEVSLPAGVALTLPSFGGRAADFAYHGAAAGDINRDGLIDLFVTGAQRNFLYINNGDGTFEEMAEDAWLALTPRATAPLMLDYDNDGDLDLFLTAIGEQMLFENQSEPGRRLAFIDSSLESEVAVRAVGFSAVAGDANADGWPDIYVASYNRYGQIMPDSWHRALNGTANLLFINQKDGTFKEEAAAWGVQDTRWSYAAVFSDLDGDDRQDLYVANDFGENAFYINLGDRFEDRAESIGVLDPGNGMGVSLGDYNNDGLVDIHVTNMSSTAGQRILNRLFPESDSRAGVLRKLASGNTLLQGRPDGSFSDVSREVGPFQAGWAWGGGFFDFDNDGWQDLYTPNGFISGKTMNDT